MQITRKGYYTIEYDGELLKKPDGSTRQATTRDDCYEYISEDGRSGIFTIYSPNREVEVPVINVPGVSVNPVGPNVIFESNFANDADYSISDTSLFVAATGLTGWDGVKAIGSSSLTIQNTGGVGGSKAMRVSYAPKSELTQPTVSMLKHLTGNMETGYSDLYIRYNVKLPDAFRMGSSSSNTPFTAEYWKWLRLWQNTSPTIVGIGVDGEWTENRIDSGYLVSSFTNGDPYLYGTYLAGFFQDPDAVTAGSSNGERYRARYITTDPTPDYPTDSGPYWDSMNNGDWQFDFTDTGTGDGDLLNTPQDWHTIEVHAQLSDGVTLGLFEVWFDGVLQADWSDLDEFGGASAITPDPTPTRNVIATEGIAGSNGWNAAVLFDNMSNWNAEWDTAGVEGWIDVNDIVIATSRIGHSYVATGDGS